MNISTPRQLRRALTGSNSLYSFGVFLVSGYPVIAAAMIMLFPGVPAASGLKAAIFFAYVFGLCVIIVLGRRRRASREDFRHLKKSGAIEDAIADLNSPDAFVIREAIARSEEKHLDNVLGSRFLFAFTAGRILHYYQISKLTVDTDLSGGIILSVTDAKGKSFPVVRRKAENDSDIADAVSHIQKHYPGCPKVIYGRK